MTTNNNNNNNNNIAVIIKHPLNDVEFVLVKQTPPPKFNDEEYDSYVDSPLWDLPSTKLNLLEQGSEQGSRIFVDGYDSLQLDLSVFDVDSALTQVLSQIEVKTIHVEGWRYLKVVEEPEFGPGKPIRTIYVIGSLLPDIPISQESSSSYTWFSSEKCLDLLKDVKPSSERVGPLVVIGLLNDLVQSGWKGVPSTLPYQEYPPGVILVPMRSRTQKPFQTTNLAIFAPQNVSDYHEDVDNNYVACGDALIVDPGCHFQLNEQLKKVVAALPKKLIVLITHHHRDHVDGLSTIEKCNPEATLLAHENTMKRLRKGEWSLGYTKVSGGETICIGGEKLSVIFAPNRRCATVVALSILALSSYQTTMKNLLLSIEALEQPRGHTDGHVALLHDSTNTLIVGDHCVGQGSAILDIFSGGNMTDYFKSTYKFIDLSPHALVPMHGRVNLWPKNMLSSYLRNRRSREADILKTIENGANTLVDIISQVYAEVDRSLWVPASSNVRLHVEHLAEQDKLPKPNSTNFSESLQGFSLETFKSSIAEFSGKEFSIQKFRRTWFPFLARYIWPYLISKYLCKNKKPKTSQLLIFGAVASFALLIPVITKLYSKFSNQ
ncbi:hypothetical protein ACFE04_016357 [Oxalis oulophora]